jgi:sulfite reductase (NADPH) flavoprotein alpha-component
MLHRNSAGSRRVVSGSSSIISAELWRWLEGGAYFYVCSDGRRMAADVERALKDIAAEQGGLTEEKAAEYVAGLGKAGRYLRDVY